MLPKLRFSRHRAVVFAGLACAGLALATAQEALAQPSQAEHNKEMIAKGRITYVRYCVSCHGKEARGDGPLSKDLRVPVPDLTTLSSRSGGKYPYDRVVRVISKGNEVKGHGSTDMPAWGPAFNRTDGIEASVDEAIRNLARYLESVQRSK
jgi:mono/diheme cytochrome c family protein